MSLHYEDGGLRLFHGSNLDILPTLPDNSYDSIVTDPPYELGFMGKGWDSTGIAYDVAVWRECLRVLKPGGFLLAFGGSRTWHRLAVAIEDAGFEVRDSIAWLYGSGFPKSLDVSKAIDKTLGAEGSLGGPKSAAHAGWIERGAMRGKGGSEGHEGYQRPWMDDEVAVDRAAREYLPGSEQAQAFKGWGTALKPAFEPIVVARKPLSGTVAANVLAWGTGALNIDASRVAFQSDADRKESTEKNQHAKFGTVPGQNNVYGDYSQTEMKDYDGSKGRWPTNVVLDESQAVALDAQTGVSVSRGGSRGAGGQHGAYSPIQAQPDVKPGFGDEGGASRFFPTFRYEAKAPSSERPEVDGTAHATVKPLDLMRWLVKLVTRRGGRVLDPFAGSGTTGEAALLEGCEVDLIELEADHLPLILARVRKPLQVSMFDLEEGVA